MLRLRCTERLGGCRVLSGRPCRPSDAPLSQIHHTPYCSISRIPKPSASMHRRTKQRRQRENVPSSASFPVALSSRALMATCTRYIWVVLNPRVTSFKSRKTPSTSSIRRLRGQELSKAPPPGDRHYHPSPPCPQLPPSRCSMQEQRARS